MNAAKFDRKLAPYRTASGTLSSIQREVAVRCEPWAETASGALGVDTLALCGVSMASAIVWALDATETTAAKTSFHKSTELLNAHFIGHFKAQEPGFVMSRSGS